MSHRPFLTIVIPTLNERDFIRTALDELCASAGEFPHEVIVADGGSTDGTQAIVHEYAQSFPSVRLIDNPRRIQSAAVNLAASLADPLSEIIIRADAHCAYPRHFVETIVDALLANDATSVVVPMFTVGKEGTYQQAVANAQNSKLGNGGSAHRSGGTPSGWVDHGHHAAFRKDFFLGLGGYDESFKTNEDAEYDVRAALSGGKVWMAREAEINYFPRTTAVSLARQYFGYGLGRSQTVLKHKARPKPRQMAPFVVFCAFVLGIILSPVSIVFLLPALGYLALCFAFSMKIAGNAPAPQVLSAFVVMHLSWGAGFTVGLIRKAADTLSERIRGAKPRAFGE